MVCDPPHQLRQELFTGEVMADLLDDNLETASFDGKSWSNPKHGGGAPHGHYIPWLTIANQADSVPPT